MDKQILRIIINSMLNDNEFNAGGIFSKEKYYMKKYNLTEKQITRIEVALYFLVNMNNKEYAKRLDNL